MPAVDVPEVRVEPRVAVAPASAALIVVDMQNDFVMPGGALVVADAAGTIPAIQRLLALARAEGMAVFFTQDTHDPGDPEFPIWGEHVLRGSWGWQIVDDLAPHPGERVIQKLRYDGFFGTSLDHELRLRRVQTAIICGTVANICVLHTAGSAALHGYRVILPVDAVSAIIPFDLQAAIRQVSFLYRGVITTSEGIAFCLLHSGKRGA
ncbi:MAG TPA: isochorismatase family cysteine hydrolase [bacterium]|nr:isochorismatase family cysteine hydrolase [bacterium]